MESLAAGRLPQLDRFVITPAGQGTARRIKGHAQDRALVPFERAQQLHARRDFELLLLSSFLGLRATLFTLRRHDRIQSLPGLAVNHPGVAE